MSRAFIIDPTISAIDGLYDLLGIGIPNQGGILYSSLEYFEKALEELAAAFPGDGWLGSAADKYAGKNRNHVNFFQELADLDRQLISLIHDQANAVQTTRDILEGAKKGLEFVRPVAVDLTYIPVVGHALSAAFQAPFCAGAMA